MKHAIQTHLKKQWKEWRNSVFFVAFVFIPFKSVIADWNWVPTGSMKPTILEGDMVFVNKLAYDIRVPLTRHSLWKLEDPQRGDISIMFSPEDEVRLVKRVIGLPGDTIEMRHNILKINGEILNYEPLAQREIADMDDILKKHAKFASEQIGGKEHGVMSVPGTPDNYRSFRKLIVPEDHYFVMGDNRDQSKDSRMFGFVKRDRFVGEAKGIIMSFDKEGFFKPRFGRFFSSLE